MREHSPDLITLTLQLETGPLHIHNCYNEPPSKELGVLRLLPQALKATGQHILVGAFNLYHPMWSEVAMPTQHALADGLIDIANGLQDHWLQGFAHSYRRSFYPGANHVFPSYRLVQSYDPHGPPREPHRCKDE